LPSRRSGKMLEETRLDYALMTVFVEVWISIGSCRRLLLDDWQPGSYRFVFRVSTGKRACVYEYRVNSRVVGNPEVIRVDLIADRITLLEVYQP